MTAEGMFHNEVALGAVKAGLENAAARQTCSLGSFARYADEDID